MSLLSFKTVSKKIYYLGKNLTKKVKDLYSGSITSLKKKIKTLEDGKTS